MTYNWPEIFKNKTDKELHEIYSGNSYLDAEAEAFAKTELEARGFDLNKKDENKKILELESLLREEKTIKKEDSGPIPKTTYLLFTGILGAIYFLIIIAGACFDLKFVRNYEFTDYLFHFFFSTVIAVMGFVDFFHRKKRNAYRKERFNHLIKEFKAKANGPL